MLALLSFDSLRKLASNTRNIGLVGRHPAFAMETIEVPTWRAYVMTPLAAGPARLAGIFFQKATLGLHRKQRQWTKVPGWPKPAVGAALTRCLGTTVFFLTGHPAEFIPGIGDDWTDEDLFRVLPSTAYSVRVGLANTAAHDYLSNHTVVRRMLREMTIQN
ncbi:MAG: hypothetical protein ACREDS_02535 [Limisphaerales bacterium]